MKLRTLLLTLAITTPSLTSLGQTAPTSGIPEIVPNIPFSAQELTTATITHDDGTTINLAHRIDVARNSAGSTRQELRILPNSSPAAKPTGSVFIDIHDVPDGLAIHLEPAASTGTVTTLRKTRRVITIPVSIPVGAIASSTQYLGTKSINGYLAEGSRQTLLFPAGTRSRNVDVTQTTDKWYSPDLQAVLLTETKDSLNNSTTTTLTQIVQSEPDPALFTIPQNCATTTKGIPAITYRQTLSKSVSRTTNKGGLMPAKPNPCFQHVLIGSLAVLLPFAVSVASASQAVDSNAAAASQQQQSAIPLSHLYMHFLVYEAHLEQVAQAHPEVPKGGTIKDRLRKRIGLSEAEWKYVSDSSLRMQSALHPLETQAHALIDADRKACQSNPRSCSSTPPNLPQLKELQKQKAQAVIAESAALEAALGTQSTAKFRAYLQNDFSRHVKLITVSPQALKAARRAGKGVAQ